MKKIIAISLALHLLIFNVGLAVNTHYCGGQVVETSFSIGIQNLDCGMSDMDQVNPSASKNEDQVIPISCCDNQHQVIQLEDSFDVQTQSLDLNQVFIIALVQHVIQPIFYAVENEVNYTLYAPPPLEQDIQVLFQSFLI